MNTLYTIAVRKYFVLLIATLSFQSLFSQPVISSFTPTSGYSGTNVTISGKNFTGATAVSFGGVPAQYISIVDDSTIIATPDTGLTGAVTVVTSLGQASLNGFIYKGPPVIYSISPDTVRPGTFTTVTGKYFTGVYLITIAGNAVTPTIVSDSVLTFTPNIPLQPFTAPLQLFYDSALPYVKVGSITNIPVPRLSSISPQTGSTGTKVLLLGQSFTGATTVTLGGVLQDSVTVLNDDELTFVVTTATPSGFGETVSVISPSGPSIDDVSFKYIPPGPVPVINSCTPMIGSPGDTITIKGYTLPTHKALQLVDTRYIALAFFQILLLRLYYKITMLLVVSSSQTLAGHLCHLRDLYLIHFYQLSIPFLRPVDRLAPPLP